MAAELGRPMTVDEVRPAAAAALQEVFGLELEVLPGERAASLWRETQGERLPATR